MTYLLSIARLIVQNMMKCKKNVRENTWPAQGEIFLIVASLLHYCKKQWSIVSCDNIYMYNIKEHFISSNNIDTFIQC